MIKEEKEWRENMALMMTGRLAYEYDLYLKNPTPRRKRMVLKWLIEANNTLTKTVPDGVLHYWYGPGAVDKRNKTRKKRGKNIINLR